jgi:ABC-2 type transport system permease protein
MHRLNLIYVFFKIGIMNELAYRVNFYVQVASSLMSLGTVIAGLLIIFSHTDRLGDWTSVDILALLGIYMLVAGAIRLFIQPSMQQMMEDVRKGTLDYTLTKPEDAQFLISIGQVRIWKLTDVFLGILVLGVALTRRGVSLGFDETAGFALVLICGGVIIYSFWLMLATHVVLVHTY